MAKYSIFRNRARREQFTAKPPDPLPEGATETGVSRLGEFLIRFIAPAPIPENAPETLTAAAIRERRREKRKARRKRREKATPAESPAPAAKVDRWAESDERLKTWTPIDGSNRRRYDIYPSQWLGRR